MGVTFAAEKAAKESKEKKVDKRGLHGLGYAGDGLGLGWGGTAISTGPVAAVVAPAVGDPLVAAPAAVELGRHTHTHTTITRNIGIPIPHPVPVPVDRPVPVRVPVRGEY